MLAKCGGTELSIPFHPLWGRCKWIFVSSRLCVCLRACMPGADGVRWLSLLRCLPCKHGDRVQPLEPMEEGGKQFPKVVLLPLVTWIHYGMCMHVHVWADACTNTCTQCIKDVLRQYLIMWPWILGTCFIDQGWFQTDKRSTGLCLQSAEVKVVHRHAWLRGKIIYRYRYKYIDIDF